TATSRHPRGLLAPTSRTSGSGPVSPTSCTRSGMTIWPPSGSKSARSRRFRLRGDLEVPFHAARGMRVALIGVGAGLEFDRTRRLTRERDAGLLVQTRAFQMEVVNRGLVLDLDPERPGLDCLEVLVGLLDLDRVAGADLTRQTARLGLDRSNENRGRGRDGEFQ